LAVTVARCGKTHRPIAAACKVDAHGAL